MLRVKDLSRKVQRKVAIINKVLSRYPTFSFSLDQLRDIEDINYKMFLEFVEQPHIIGGKPRVHKIKYEHLIYRGFNTKSVLYDTTLYLAIFRNVRTNMIHPKIGTTKSYKAKNRFYKTSKMWQFCGFLWCKTGPRNEILAIEKQLKHLIRRHDIAAKDVIDFNFGGQTELMIPSVDISHVIWDEIRRIFNNHNFEDLNYHECSL